MSKIVVLKVCICMLTSFTPTFFVPQKHYNNLPYTSIFTLQIPTSETSSPGDGEYVQVYTSRSICPPVKPIPLDSTADAPSTWIRDIFASERPVIQTCAEPQSDIPLPDVVAMVHTTQSARITDHVWIIHHSVLRQKEGSH